MKLNSHNFKQNLKYIYKDRFFKPIFIILFLFFNIICIFPIFGIYTSIVNSGSDKNGVYITFSEPTKFNYQYSLNDYVSYCLTDKIALESAISYGLPSKGGICKNGSYPLLKHICGLPNQVIQYKNDKFFIESNIINNNFIQNKKIIHKVDWNNYPDYKIPENSYFICGENLMSFDSRYYGAVKREDIIGKSYRIIPF